MANILNLRLRKCLTLIQLVAVLLLYLGPHKTIAMGVTCHDLFEGDFTNPNYDPRIHELWLQIKAQSKPSPFPTMTGVQTKSKSEKAASRTIQVEYWRTGPYIVKQTDSIHSRFSFYNYDYATHSVEVLRAYQGVFERDQVSAMKMEPTTRDLKVDHKVREEISKKIFESLSFVLKAYKEEKQWPNEFLKRLVTVAFQYAEYSTYINVRSKEGKIVGSVRIIQTPTLNKEKSLSRNERWLDTSLFSELKVKASDLPNPELWREIYGSEDIHLTGLNTPVTEQKNGLDLVPTPFENILGRRYVEERDLGQGLSSVVEPGNFAILRNRDLPVELRNIVAPTLYYHLARLVRPEARGGLDTGPTFVGTYASVGSTSDRFYQSLGFKVKETIPERSARNPTDEPWNVLTTDSEGLTTALRLRLQLRDGYTNREMNSYFWEFDYFETQVRYPEGALPTN